jgi:peptide/nickel transport system substrate-binding protein
MRTDTPPFDNNEVRQALKYAVDREALLQSVLRGHGVLGNDHPIGRSNRYHADELEQRTYDPDKAKFHLKNAGLSSLKVDLSAADAAFAGAVDAAVLYKEHAAKPGIEINVVREPNDGYWSNVWLKKPWCAVYWGGRPTEDWMFSTAYAGRGALERHLLGARALQPALGGGPRRTQGGQAPGNVRGDAAPRPRRGRRRRPHVRQLRLRHVE